LQKTIFHILILSLILLLFAVDNIALAKNSRRGEIAKYLPSTPSICIYIKSLKKVWRDFENSYFWKKYKLTSQGKQLQKSIDSISASFLIIGLTFNDLLEIFSDNGLLALWINNNQIINFMYIINSNTKIFDFIERLEYFAIANKINYNKYDYYSSEIMNFENKIFVANTKKYIVICDDKIKIEKTVYNIIKETNTTEFPLLDDFEKNKNIILWHNIRKPVLYSLKFRNNLIIEALSDIETISTNARMNLSAFKFIPAKVNFISFSENCENVKDLFIPLFESMDTNIINIDIKYFNSFLEKVRWFPDGNSGVVGIRLTSKSTNVIFVFKTTNLTVWSNFINKSTDSFSFYGKRIYSNPSQKMWKYLSFYGKYILISNNLNFIKTAIKGYKKRKNFYYTKKMKKILFYSPLRRKIIYSFIWMDLTKYIIIKSFLHPKEKWLLYNAYIKTFARLLIYGYKKNSSYHTILKTYSPKKR